MFVSRVLARVSRSSLLSSPQTHHLLSVSNQFHSLVHESPNKLVNGQVSLFHLSSSLFQRFGFASSASPELSSQTEDSVSGQSEVANQTKESGSISDSQSSIENFDKSLLDVADYLERASSRVKESLSKIDTSKDSAGAAPLLKTVLESVEMTEKQLVEVFEKYGVEKYDPLNEPFDPDRQNAVFQFPDASKPPGTVAVVLKSGYMLYDELIRPAQVGVTQAFEDDAADKRND